MRTVPHVSKTSLLNALLVVLSVLALALGYLVYEKFAHERTPGEVWARLTQPTLSEVVSGAGEVNGDIPGYEGMSDEELVAGMPNAGEVSMAALEAYGTAVYNRAVRGEEVRIGGGCRATPSVLSAALNSEVRFVNEDTRTHALNLTPELVLEVAAGASASVTLDFETGGGLYGFVCDNERVPAGILVVQ